MFNIFKILFFTLLFSLYSYSAQAVQGEGRSSGGTTPLSLNLSSSCRDTTHNSVQGSLGICAVAKSKAFSLQLIPKQGNVGFLAIDITNIPNITKQEYYAPFDLDAEVSYNGTDRLHYFVDSNNTDFIVATVDDNGKIHINATQNSGGTGQARITLIVYGLVVANYIYIDVNIEESSFPNFSTLAFTQIANEEWNELAVLKVLNTFAFGGHASKEQIETWASMPPEYAIVQMLNFESNNKLLSPTKSKLPQTSSIETLAEFWSSDSEDNTLNEHDKQYYKKSRWSALTFSWYRAVLVRGLNPFLHRVGLWETNYHMSANSASGVHSNPLFTHYDSILSSLASNSAYSTVIAQGAKNAAIAFQYGHNYNVYSGGTFIGNEDFAREYHQLFFGILGEYDHSYHELKAIPNTARALTDMYARWRREEDGGPDNHIVFGTDEHYPSDLDILKNTISGVDASIKIDNIALVAIEHNESKQNLPIMIIEHFADNNLSNDTKARIRDSWNGMTPRKLLPFLWAYALSTDFHNEKRFKYLTSLERTMGIHSKMVVDNSDNIYDWYRPSNYLSYEEIAVFSPIHDVFGHQTALEASDNPNIFQANYNRTVSMPWLYTYAYKCVEDSDDKCIEDDNGDKTILWEKDWSKKIPADDDGNYVVEDVALWLWKYFIGDGGKNYGVVERAYIVTLLNGKDLALFIDEDDPLHAYSLDDLTNNSNIVQLINDGAVAKMQFKSNDNDDRYDANAMVGLAIAFIVATPYIYVQEGK